MKILDGNEEGQDYLTDSEFTPDEIRKLNIVETFYFICLGFGLFFILLEFLVLLKLVMRVIQ